MSSARDPASSRSSRARAGDLLARRHRRLRDRDDVRPLRRQSQRLGPARSEHDRRTPFAIQLRQVVQRLDDLLAPLLRRPPRQSRAQQRTVPPPDARCRCRSRTARRSVRSACARPRRLLAAYAAVPPRRRCRRGCRRLAAAIASDGNGDSSCSPSGIRIVRVSELRGPAYGLTATPQRRRRDSPPHRTGIACSSSSVSSRWFVLPASRSEGLSTSHNGRRSPYAGGRTLVTCQRSAAPCWTCPERSRPTGSMPASPRTTARICASNGRWRRAGVRRPLASGRRDDHRTGPADLAARVDHAVLRRLATGDARRRRCCCRRPGTSSTRCTASTTARPSGCTPSPARRRRWSSGCRRWCSCPASRSRM